MARSLAGMLAPLLPADSRYSRRLLRRLAGIWSTPAVADVPVVTNARLHATLGRLIGRPPRIELGLRATATRSDLTHVLTHEAAHAALALTRGPVLRPHGAEWQELMSLAGIEAAMAARWRCGAPSSGPRVAARARYEHWCPICQASRTARRPVKAWRCAACVAAGLSGTLEITRSDNRSVSAP